MKLNIIAYSFMNFPNGDFSVQNLKKQQKKQKFRGNKISIKQFRRNLLLKTKTKLLNCKPNTQIIITNSVGKQQKCGNKCQLTDGRFGKRTMKSLSLSHNAMLTPHPFASSECNFSTVSSEIIDKRMEEYLSVVFKKVETDTDNIMKTFQKVHSSNKPLAKEPQNPNINFIKRLKINSMKLRIKKQKDSSQLMLIHNSEKKQKLQSAFSLIEKIRRTESFLSPPKRKLNGSRQKQKLNKTFGDLSAMLRKTEFRKKIRTEIDQHCKIQGEQVIR